MPPAVVVVDALGMAVIPTAVVVEATMTVFGGVPHAAPAMMVMASAMMDSYGLRAPAMVTIGVANVVSGDRAIYTSQPATRAASPAHRPRLRDAMTPPAMDSACDVQAPSAESGARRAACGHEHTWCV